MTNALYLGKQSYLLSIKRVSWLSLVDMFVNHAVAFEFGLCDVENLVLGSNIEIKKVAGIDDFDCVKENISLPAKHTFGLKLC